jgi:hypothetical protein
MPVGEGAAGLVDAVGPEAGSGAAYAAVDPRQEVAVDGDVVAREGDRDGVGAVLGGHGLRYPDSRCGQVRVHGVEEGEFGADVFGVAVAGTVDSEHIALVAGRHRVYGVVEEPDRFEGDGCGEVIGGECGLGRAAGRFGIGGQQEGSLVARGVGHLNRAAVGPQSSIKAREQVWGGAQP